MYIQLNYNTSNNKYSIETGYGTSLIQKNMNCGICGDDKLFYNVRKLNDEIINHKLYGSQLIWFCNSVYSITTIENYNRRIMKINKDFNQIIELEYKLPLHIWYTINSYISNIPKYDYLLKNLFISSYFDEIYKFYTKYFYNNKQKWNWKQPYIRYFCKYCIYEIEYNKCIYCNNSDNETNINHICYECYCNINSNMKNDYYMNLCNSHHYNKYNKLDVKSDVKCNNYISFNKLDVKYDKYDDYIKYDYDKYDDYDYDKYDD